MKLIFELQYGIEIVKDYFRGRDAALQNAATSQNRCEGQLDPPECHRTGPGVFAVLHALQIFHRLFHFNLVGRSPAYFFLFGLKLLSEIRKPECL